MKKIRATEKADPWVAIPNPFSTNPSFNSGEMTLMPGEEVEVFNEEILVSPEVKKVLQDCKIEIIDDDGKVIEGCDKSMPG